MLSSSFGLMHPMLSLPHDCSSEYLQDQSICPTHPQKKQKKTHIHTQVWGKGSILSHSVWNLWPWSRFTDSRLIPGCLATKDMLQYLEGDVRLGHQLPSTERSWCFTYGGLRRTPERRSPNAWVLMRPL